VSQATAKLARSITWAGSKQTYFTGRLMIDRDLVDDFFRAYAYFRWLDDIIDVSARTVKERHSFIRQQKKLIDRLYKNERLDGLTPEEEIVADLISHDRRKNSGLQSFIRNMFAIIEFDAFRIGKTVSYEELVWYSKRLAKSVTDGIQYFISNGYPYPTGDDRYAAAYGAHITHLLRDTLPDTADGFINISREHLRAHGIGPEDINSEPYRIWVRERVKDARSYFREGKRYLDKLDVLRCKIVGHWYTARFEAVLDTIERDGFHLRPDYEERRRLSTWLKIGWLAAEVTFRHFTRRDRDQE
jgi:phytoene/squalene synthetase